jgi:hypothetical protein
VPCITTCSRVSRTSISLCIWVYLSHHWPAWIHRQRLAHAKSVKPHTLLGDEILISGISHLVEPLARKLKRHPHQDPTPRWPQLSTTLLWFRPRRSDPCKTEHHRFILFSNLEIQILHFAHQRCSHTNHRISSFKV